MPPKKAKGKKDEPPPEITVGEYNLSRLSLAELQGFVYRLQKEVEKTRDARNVLQVQRDRIDQFWKITENELEVTDAKVQLLEKQIEDVSKNYEQKCSDVEDNLVYLQYEKEQCLKERKDDIEISKNESSKILQKAKEKNFKKYKENKHHVSISRQKCEETVAEIRMRNKNFILDMIEAKEKTLRTTIDSFEDMYEDMRTKLLLLKDVEVHDFCEQKTKQYNDFIENHYNRIEEMKSYFKSVTSTNLAVIDALKTEIKSLKEAEDQMKKNRSEIDQENKILQPVIRKTRFCKIGAAYYEQEKTSNAFTQRMIKRYTKKIQDLEKSNMEISKKCKEVDAAKVDLKVNFVSGLKAIQDGLNEKNLPLEFKIENSLETLEDIGVNTEHFRLLPVDCMECLR